MKNKKGFTLIELIVILALAGIVIVGVMSFFIANYRSYDRINTESELQYQSQYIINYMTNKILEANKIKSVNGSEDESGETNVNNIVFEHGADEFKFEIDGNNKIIFTDINGNAKELSGNETELIMTPIPAGKFTDAYGLKFTLVIENSNKKQNYSAEQTVYMRNSNNN